MECRAVVNVRADEVGQAGSAVAITAVLAWHLTDSDIHSQRR